MNAGADNGDGTWTIQTSDPSSLTVTTPADFAGATVLGVHMTWTNADGSVGNAFVSDNVEAYAPGSPIFALSSDDNLTGSGGSDLFVFAQPIGNNRIFNFNAADKIDLIGFAVADFTGLVIAQDGDNAIVTVGSGQSITLAGVSAGSLKSDNFVFNVEPDVFNTGTMTIGDGAILPLGGTIHNSGNSGVIALDSTGDETDLEILFKGATLAGGGHVTLSDSDGNVIFGGSAETLLTNLDNTISGAGQIGAAQMTLHNGGVIEANGTHALTIDTGSNAVVNWGTLEASHGGTLVIKSDVADSLTAADGTHDGLLWAHGGSIVANGSVNGGAALIDLAGNIEFGSASSANVAFGDAAPGSVNTLKLDDVDSFTGTVAALNADDVLDFGDVDFANAQPLTFTANAQGTGGTLTVSDGVDTAHINLVGQYTADAFHVTADLTGGTLVTYNPLQTV